MTTSHFSQEGHQGVMVEVDVLMNLNQFCRAQPHASTFYSDPQSYVRQGRMEIGLSAIVSVVEPPTIILDWDPRTFTLQQISVQVYH